MKKVFVACLLFVSGCSMTGDGSKWKNLGPDQVHCESHEFKMCSYYGSLYICECRLA